MLQKLNFDFKKGQGDYRLLPVEFFPEQIPFEVKRTYFLIANETQTQTGEHSHYIEQEVFLVVKGQAELYTMDENHEENLTLLNPGEAVYVPAMVWHGFRMIAPETVIVAFSSTHHRPDRGDYQENKEKFMGRYQE